MGIVARAGTVNINGGTITGYGSSFTDTAATDDATINYPLTTGAGIAVSQTDTSNAPTVTIAKGDITVKGYVALALTNPKSLTDSTTIPIITVGGIFESIGQSSDRTTTPIRTAKLTTCFTSSTPPTVAKPTRPRSPTL